MAIVSDTSHTNSEPSPNTRNHHRSSCSPPPSLAAFASVRASHEAERGDAAAATDTDDDSEEQEECAAAAAAAAAELADEAKWEAAAAAESEDDAGGDADTGEPDSPPQWWPSNSARRDPRKVELFRSLDAACEARRLQEARRRKNPPPPAGAGDPDEPIWPPKSPHWRRFRELSTTKSSPANPVLNPDENSLSLPPSNKNDEMVDDKVVDQGDETQHSSQSVPSENNHEENPLPVPPKKLKYSINTYAVQCGKCWKWRLIPTKIKYDEIREKSRQVRFLCEHVHGWKPGVSCDDPADISQDDGFWVVDRPCISQAPLGWERKISIRSEGCSTFADVYYFPPTGKKLRSLENLKVYLQDNPDCDVDLHKSEYLFKIPERLRDYLKRCRRQSKPLEPKEVLLLSRAPPIHEDLAPNCVLALSDKGKYCM